MSKSDAAPALTAAEAEAIATAVALHHLHAAQSAGVGGPVADPFTPWAREALYTSVDKNLHRMTAWGHRTWG
ncbi:MAG: hypothetical protein PGN13_13795 [Patulibacter minatonensis]